MSQLICPICGEPYIYPEPCCHSARDLIAEIERLEERLKTQKDIIGGYVITERKLYAEIERLNALWTASESSGVYLLAEVARLNAFLDHQAKSWQAECDASEAEIERLMEELQEWRGYQRSCMTDVPRLRKEIERLKAALETARNEYELMRTEILARISERDEAMKERDKARKLARHFYRLYLIERENYLGISADEDIWF